LISTQNAFAINCFQLKRGRRLRRGRTRTEEKKQQGPARYRREQRRVRYLIDWADILDHSM